MENKNYPYKFCVIRDRNGDISKRWYIEFYAYDLDEQKMVRRVDYSINRYKTAKERYNAAKHRAKEIDKYLAKGYVISYARKKHSPSKIEKKLTIKEAVSYACKIKALDGATRTKQVYATLERVLTEFFDKNNYSSLPVEELSSRHIDKFFDYMKIERESKITNRTLNNYLQFTRALLNFLVAKKIIKENFSSHIRKLPTIAKSHVPYSDEQISLIKKHLEKTDPQLWLFCLFIYYTFARKNELRFLQIKNIGINKIHIPAKIKVNGKEIKVSKNNKSEYVIIPKALQDIIENLKLRELPGDFFVFSQKGKPGETYLSSSYFVNKYVDMKKELGIPSTHTLYSWKHTGVCKLYLAIKDINKVKEQCRHHDISVTAIYLRDLGLFDNKEVEEQFPSI